MNFSSIIFLFLFLPVVLGLHAITGKRFRNLFLLIASLIFYAWGTDYVLLLVGMIAITYVIGHLIQRSGDQVGRWLLLAAVALNLLVLVYYKLLLDPELTMTGIVQSVVGGLNLTVPTAMPIGISFYTFQSISYLIDIKNRQVQPCKSIINFGLYIAFFPHLTAGPILQYKDFERQFFDRQITSESFAYGVRRFAQGLAKKVLIANALASFSEDLWGANAANLGTAALWWNVLCYTLQIYHDFSGYSDMAVGLGVMFGFRLPENFNYPYTADSMRGFWDRWHMSLSTWFRYYLFFPMTRVLLNAAGRERQMMVRIVVTFVTMTLIGIWHGFSGNYLIWGALHGALLGIESLLSKPLAKLWQPLRHVYTMFFVMIGWVFFANPSPNAAFTYLSGMFSYQIGALPLADYIEHLEVVTVLLGIAFSFPIMNGVSGWVKRITPERIHQIAVPALSVLATLILLIGSAMQLASETYQAFLYFRF